MDVLSIEEQEDGSAIVTMNMTQQENDMLVEYAVVNLLKEHIERTKNEHRSNGDDGGLHSEETLKSEDL